MMRKICCAVMTVIILIGLMLPVAAIRNKVYGSYENEEMMIALTFDDGPHPKITPKILEILRKYGVKATFFEIGENVEAYPDVTRSVIENGHEIGNHTYTHPHISNLTNEVLSEEMERCDKAIFKVAGVHPTLFRPPEGVVDQAVKVIADVNDYSVILWRVDTRDWAGTSAQSIKNNVMKNIRSGDIILMHDYVMKSCHTVEAVELIIPALLERGFKFVTVSELIGR